MKQMARLSAAVLFFVFAFSHVRAGEGEVAFHPIRHASFVMLTGETTVYVDPVGEAGLFDAYPRPDIILITHEHRDHFSKEVITHVSRPDTLIICTKTVREGLDRGVVLNNGDRTTHKGVEVEAIPACNLTPERMKYHPRGRGNGYVVTVSGRRVYISGDTEDIPEMRALTGIDDAFVCMNLPYTMTVDQAVSAVLEFHPKRVFPYHYRGKTGISDIARFKAEVERAGRTAVTLLPWYE